MTRFLLPVVLIVVSVVAFFTFGQPWLDEINQLKIRKDNLTAGEDSLIELIGRQNEILAQYNSFSADQKSRLDKFLPNNIDNVRLIIDVNAIAARYGLQLRGLGIRSVDAKAGEPTTGEQLLDQDAVILSFSVTASYNLFKTLLDDLANSLRLIDITSLALTANDQGLYNYNVEIKTYWLK